MTLTSMQSIGIWGAMQNQTIEVHSRTLEPFRAVAAVLGVPVGEVIKEALEDRALQIMEG